MSFPCLSRAAIQCNEYSWRASRQRHAVWKRVFLEFLSLKGSRWCVRQGLFLYHDPVPPNSNSSKILFQTWTSLRPHFNSLILVIICAEAPAKLCYAPCVYLEAFLFGLRQNYFAAWLFQELSSTMGQWLLHLLSLHCWPVFKNAFWKLCWIFLCLKILILGQDCMFRSHHKQNYISLGHWLGCLPKQPCTLPNSSVSHVLVEWWKGNEKALKAQPYESRVCVYFIEICISQKRKRH